MYGGKVFSSSRVDCTVVVLRSGSSLADGAETVDDGLECAAAGFDAAGADFSLSCCFDEA